VVNTRAIFTHKDGIVLRSTYHVFDLYANHTSRRFDTLVETATFPGVTQDNKEADVPVLDAVATLDTEGGRLNVTLVNSHKDHTADCRVQLRGIQAAGQADLRTVWGETADSYNDIDRPDDVRIVSRTLAAQGDSFAVELPPHSVSVLGFSVSG
jgi:alpha-N-arabinofuranosidase